MNGQNFVPLRLCVSYLNAKASRLPGLLLIDFAIALKCYLCWSTVPGIIRNHTACEFNFGDKKWLKHKGTKRILEIPLSSKTLRAAIEVYLTLENSATRQGRDMAYDY